MGKKKKVIIEICFIILIVLGLFTLKHTDKKFDEELSLSGELAIGTFVRFNTQYVGYSRSYEFSYYNNQKEKLTEVGSRKMPNKEKRVKIGRGNQFLVI